MENKTIKLCCGRRGCPMIIINDKNVMICDENRSIFLENDEFEELKKLIKENKI